VVKEVDAIILGANLDPLDPLDTKGAKSKLKKALKEKDLEAWKARWLRETRGRVIYNLNPSPCPEALELYKDQSKVLSLITIQLRS
jgi:hypothetical protein